MQIVDSLNVGGAEVLAVNIANGLAEKNITSHLCATRKEGLLKENIASNVGYLYLDRKKVFDFGALWRLRKYMVANDINTLHAHASSWFIAFCIKMLRPSLKLIWHDHFGNSDYLSERKTFPLAVFSYFFSKILVVNSSLKNWAESKLHCKDVLLLNNFAFFEKKEAVTVLKGIAGKRIVHLAGFREQKDHLNLLEAFKKIKETQTDWTLHLIGKDYEDAYSMKVKEFIKFNHLETSVFLYGVCSDIEPILSQATIGVLSSKSEGLPVALLEYGLAKLPVVVTNVGECSAVVQHNATGILVEALNPGKLAEGIELLIMSRTKREKLSLSINKKVIEGYSKEIFLEKIVNIYKC